MRITALFLIAALCLTTAARAENLTPDQNKAVQNVIDFYKKMGDSEAAKKLQDGLKDGSVKFGPTPDNDNAACNMSTKVIHINPSTVEAVNSPDLESWRATANLAATISHEFTHKGQDSWAWRGSYWKEKLGYGNACEKEAWGGTFEKMADWVRKTKAELESKSAKSVREQAEAAQRLKMMCQAFEVLRNDYTAIKGKVGALNMTDADGVPISLDSLLAEVKANEKAAGNAIGLANARVASFDGAYAGSFQGQKGSGKVSFKIQGFTVNGRISGSYDGDPCSGSISGRVDADGNISLNLSGAVTWGKATYPFTGSLTGVVREGRASGKWFASNKHGKPSGSWSAAK